MTDKDFFVVLSTCPDAATAARIGRSLVESAVVACVNIVPGLRSIYRWNDTVQDEPEVLMIMKTTGSCHDAYLRWVSSSTRTPQA